MSKLNFKQQYLKLLKTDKNLAYALHFIMIWLIGMPTLFLTGFICQWCNKYDLIDILLPLEMFIMFILIWLPLVLYGIYLLYKTYGRIFIKTILTFIIYAVSVYCINKYHIFTTDLQINNAKIITLLVPLCCLILSAILWNFFGKDKRKFEPVEFSSPDNMPPFEMSYMYHQDIMKSDVALTFIDWMNKGYITITNNKNKTIKKKKEYDGYNEEEKEFFKKMFGQSDTTFIVNCDTIKQWKKYTTNYINKTKEKLDKKYMDKTLSFMEDFCENLMFLSWLDICMFFFFSLWVNNNLYITNIFTFWILAPFVFLFGLYEKIIRLKIHNRTMKKYGSKFLTILYSIIFFGAVFGLTAISTNPPKYYLFYSQVIILIFLTLLTRVFQLNFVKWNGVGIQVVDRVLGFKKYLTKVEINKISTLKGGLLDEFKQLLPYIYLFDLMSEFFITWHMFAPKGSSEEYYYLAQDKSVTPHIQSMLEAVEKIKKLKPKIVDIN